MISRGKEKYRVGFVQLGCAKNRVDTEIMETILAEGGVQIGQRGYLDAVIVNTCGFVQDAKEESLEEIFRLLDMKKRGKVGKVLVGGCLSQRYAADLEREIPEVDRFFGIQDLHRVDKILSDVVGNAGEQPSRSHRLTLEDLYVLRLGRSRTGLAYLKISDGCSNLCAYCSIPAIRGSLKSRDIRRIRAEFDAILDRGIKEINLVGHDIGSYGRDRGMTSGLEVLLEELASRVTADVWVRLLYLHPENVTERLAKIIRDSPVIVDYLDIPVQHASDRVLSRMNRRYTSGYLYETFSMLREALDEPVLRTTVIVGFPGEGRRDFEQLKRFVEEIRFNHLGGFTYSREENTPAWSMDQKVSKDTAVSRLDEILTLQSEISRGKNRSLSGKTVKVLTEDIDRGGLRLTGRYFGQAPEVDGIVYAKFHDRVERGSFVSVKIHSYDHYDLFGSVEEEKEIDI